MKGYRHIIRAVAVILLQVLLIDLIEAMGIFHPYIYILVLLMMPVRHNVITDMLIGAMLGAVIDLYSNSPGVHMSACVTLCYVRRRILPHLVFAPERLKGEISSISLGVTPMTKLTVMLVVLHHAIVFALTAWSWSTIGWTILATLTSSMLTILLILFYNVTMHEKHE